MSASRERVDELAALVAAGGASADEERELAELTGTDAEAAARAAEMADAAALLAEALPPVAPPPAARARILAEVAGSTAAGAAPVDELARVRSRRAAGAAVVALIAAAAILLLWWRDHRRLAGQLSALERDNRALVTELLAADQRTDIVESPALQLATMKKGPSTVNVLIDHAGRRWLVLAFELPPEPGKDYQLWFVPSEEGAAPISAGLLNQGPSGLYEASLTLPAQLPPLKAAAISLEKQGGSPTPTDIKMIGPI